jgi:hypothetical protein
MVLQYSPQFEQEVERGYRSSQSTGSLGSSAFVSTDTINFCSMSDRALDMEALDPRPNSHHQTQDDVLSAV